MNRPCSDSHGFTRGKDQLVVGEQSGRHELVVRDRPQLPETRMAAETRQIQAKVDKKKNLLGIVLMFCCVDAKGVEHKLDGLEAAVDKVCDVCGKLGFLPVRLNENVSSRRIRDMIEIVTKIKFPPSYRFVTVYFTGHWKKGSICTADGEMSIRDIVMPFHQDTCPDMRNRINFFVFDCCRTVDSSCRESAKDYMRIENCYFLFATTPNHFAYYTETSTSTGEKKRCGRLTDIFVRLMHTENKPFLKLAYMARLEINELSKNEEIKQVVDYHENTAVRKTVCLLKESVGICRIAPTDLNVIPESPYSLCYQVTENFKGYCERIKRIEIEAERDGCSSISVHVVASVPLSNDGTFEATTKPLQESSTYQLRAVAVYNDAVLGRGEFKAHNEKLVITIDGQDKDAKDIQAGVNAKPHLLGIVFIFCCTLAKGCSPLHGLESGAQMAHDACEKLGYLPVQLKDNASSAKIIEWIKILPKKIKLPPSYHYIGVYFTGHGVMNAICTADGKLPIQRIIDPFRCEHFKNFIKLFVFDCCRTADFKDKSAHDYSSVDNLFFVFGTMPRDVGFYYDKSTGKRLGRLTVTLLNLMCTRNDFFLTVVNLAKQQLREKDCDQFIKLFDTISRQKSKTVNLLAESVGYCRVTPSHLRAVRSSNSPTCYQVTGSFEGIPKRISRIEIEAVIASEYRVVASAPLSSDGTFDATTDLLHESRVYQLRAVAVYDDALEGGKGEFRACSEEITVPREHTEIQGECTTPIKMNLPSSTLHIRTPESSTSPGPVGGYLQHFMILIFCLLLGLVLCLCYK